MNHSYVILLSINFFTIDLLVRKKLKLPQQTPA